MTTTVPDATGHFGPYGGRFVPEALIAALDELDVMYRAALADPEFQAELEHRLRTYTGRPSPLTDATRFAEHAGGARILLKREDLNHTGSHKINNVLGQALLTVRMGKTRVIAETGAGQHGVATATAAALFGLECTVYMGEEDTRRQALNVARMKLLGAEVIPVTTGSRTLKDAINEAMRDWVANVDHTHYLFGTVAGPHPFPVMVRDFQRVIGVEARQQVLDLTGRLPDAVAACVGGGSNAIGIFHPFVADAEVALYGFEAGGRRRRDRSARGDHHRRLAGRAARHPLLPAAGRGRPDHREPLDLGRAGLPGRRSEHAWLHDTGRATYEPVTDAEAMDAFALLCRTEGIIPAIESAHALAGALRLGRELGPAAVDPGQPVRPRRQGRRHRGALVRHRAGGAGMSALRDAFAAATAENRAALVGYLPAGYPSVDGAIDAAIAMVDGGCDVIEIGLPYSDPVMDGPTIQRAVDAALAGGVRIADVMRTVEARRRDRRADAGHDLLEPDRALRRRAVRRELAAAGGAGVITPDLTPEEAGPWLEATTRARHRHRLRRRAELDRRAHRDRRPTSPRGFVYAASVMGVTGARTEVGALAGDLVARRPRGHRRPGRRRPRRLDRRPGGRGRRATPTASSSAPRSSACCSTPTRPREGVARRRHARRATGRGCRAAVIAPGREKVGLVSVTESRAARRAAGCRGPGWSPGSSSARCSSTPVR